MLLNALPHVMRRGARRLEKPVSRPPLRVFVDKVVVVLVVVAVDEVVVVEIHEVNGVAPMTPPTPLLQIRNRELNASTMFG